MPYRTCRLYAMPDCMLVPPVHTRGAWIKRLVGEPRGAGLRLAATVRCLRQRCFSDDSYSFFLLPTVSLTFPAPLQRRHRAGFPLRQKVLELPGFSSAAADGMRGGELPECPGTVIPGSCAFNELMDGAYACNMLQPTCQTMVVYTQGARRMLPCGMLQTPGSR